MTSDAFESDSRPGFGRGSAVRDYWLERCEGFRAVRPDGRSLGRVRRLETRGDGTVLRLSGLRSRVVPLSAVEIVWPGASVLLIAEETVHPERLRGAVEAVRDTSNAYLPSESSGRRSRRSQSPSSAPIPSWADDTLPWWELLEDDRSSVGNRISSPLARPVSQRSWPMDWGPQRASRLGSFPPISSVAKVLFVRTKDDCTKLAIVLERQRRKGKRASSATIRAVRRGSATARSSVSRTVRHGRLALGRLLVRFGLWVAGNREPLMEISQDLRTPTRDHAASENR
jgi:hypothetical protein